MQLAHEAAMLGLETQRVIGLPLLRLSGGGACSPARGTAHGHGKNHRHGGSRNDSGSRWLGGTVTRRYRTHVRANKRRLSK
jgi:hypothetical protein